MRQLRTEGAAHLHHGRRFGASEVVESRPCLGPPGAHSGAISATSSSICLRPRVAVPAHGPQRTTALVTTAALPALPASLKSGSEKWRSCTPAAEFLLQPLNSLFQLRFIDIVQQSILPEPVLRCFCDDLRSICKWLALHCVCCSWSAGS